MRKMLIIIVIISILLGLVLWLAIKNVTQKQQIKFLESECEYAKTVSTNASEELNNARSEIQTKDKKIAVMGVQLAAYRAREAGAEVEIEPVTADYIDPNPFSGIHTNWYSCMDYRTITNKASDQYALQHDKNTRTQWNGIRTYKLYDEEFYCAALGGAFGYNVGDAWVVELRSGYKFNVILGDFKHPISEAAESDFGDPCVNYLGDSCLNVIEFIIDSENTPEMIMKAGTMSVLSDFGGLYSYGGDIADMQYLGRIWKRQ